MAAYPKVDGTAWGMQWDRDHLQVGIPLSLFPGSQLKYAVSASSLALPTVFTPWLAGGIGLNIFDKKQYSQSQDN